MEILFFLVPVAVALSGVALVLFFKAVGTGQFEDLDGDAARFLIESPQFVESQETPGVSPLVTKKAL